MGTLAAVAEAVGAIGTLIAVIVAGVAVRRSVNIRRSEAAAERLAAMQPVLRAYDRFVRTILAHQPERNPRRQRRAEAEREAARTEWAVQLRSCVEDLPLTRQLSFAHPPVVDVATSKAALTRYRERFGQELGDPESDDDTVMLMRGELLDKLHELRILAKKID